MKKSFPMENPSAQLDPAAFVADPGLIRALQAHSTSVPCQSERPLFRQGEPAVGLFIVHEGVVTLSMMSQNGHSLIAAQARPGSLLGLPGVISNQPYTLSAAAGAGAVVGFISRDDLTSLMHGDPALSLKMLAVLAAEVRSARKALL
jgi:CRP-like cAMP-binding protein